MPNVHFTSLKSPPFVAHAECPPQVCPLRMKLTPNVSPGRGGASPKISATGTATDARKPRAVGLTDSFARDRQSPRGTPNRSAAVRPVALTQ